MATRKDVANIGNLDKKVQALLKTYGDQVRDDLEEVTIKVADFGVKEIKANARTYKWGKEYSFLQRKPSFLRESMRR